MNKVLFVITRGDIVGGAQSHLLILCKCFKDKGLDISVVVGGENTILKKKLLAIGISTYEIKYFKRDISIINDFISLCIMINLIFRLKPNIVSSHSSKAGILSRISCFLLQTPIVFTAHGWAFTEGVTPNKRVIYKFIEKILALLTDKIIAVSKYDYNLALKENICKPSKIRMIHNGILLSNLVKIKNESAIVNLVMVARFDEPKDQLKLISSIRDISNVNLFLLGDGPKLNQCVSYVRSNNLASKVFFLGFVDNVSEVLAKMDIFILISNYEGFPMSTIEAMSIGLPVIISKVGGASEAVVDGVNGYIVENNIAEIKSSIERLTFDRDLRNQMGDEALKYFNDNFSAEKMVDSTYKLFQTLIK